MYRYGNNEVEAYSGNMYQSDAATHTSLDAMCGRRQATDGD